MIKKLFISILSLAMFAGAVSVAQAETIIPGPLSVSYDGDGAIFAELNVAPGGEYVKELTVTNNGTVTHSFAMATTNVVGELANHIYIEPELHGVQLWSLTVQELSELATESQTILPIIDSGEVIVLNLKARFDDIVTSEFADTVVSFDIVFGTEEAEPGVTVAVTDLGAPTTVAGASLALSPTPTAISTETGGEVLGAKDEGETSGLNGLLLLIPPIALVLSIPFVAPGIRNAVLPTLGAGTTAVLSFFTKGSLAPNLFWIILIAELVLILVLDYLIVKKTVIEVLEEEEILEGKARRAHSKKRK